MSRTSAGALAKGLEGDAVDHRPERHDEQHGEMTCAHSGIWLGGMANTRRRRQRHADVGDEQGRQQRIATIAQQPVAIEQRDGGAQAEQQPDCAGTLPACSEARVSAPKATNSPCGMKMTRVTAKTRTSARASSA